mmetsp:Transcript_12539/g.20273  ORF Transcript_12539/g.20273 Transcript_12539/m.20273 type:complete len:203 (-) Transcript_12539:557-1165(-)
MDAIKIALPCMHAAYLAVSSLAMMQSYLKSYTHDNYHGLITQNDLKYLFSDWENPASKKNGKHHRKVMPGEVEKIDDTEISIVLLDEENNVECKMKIGLSMTLKSLFNEYADERGVSLRSLWFYYEGSKLFLSSAGKKTPSELGMKNLSTIIVIDTAKSAKKEDITTNESPPTIHPKDSSSQPTKGKKGKRKKRRHNHLHSL